MNLNGKWQCHITDHDTHTYDIPATVPGCVHTDLIAAGILPNLFWRTNADLCQWVENCDVTYSRSFTVDAPAKNMYLDFEGLDVYCGVYLNGIHLGEADDMHIPWSFCVDGVLREGENLLEVKFRSPIREVKDCPKRSGAFTTERINTRRVQCTYGWDWVARFVTMGIWKDVALNERTPDRLDNLYVYTKGINPYSAQVGIKAEFADITGFAHVNFTITDPDGRIVYQKRRRILPTKDYTPDDPFITLTDGSVSDEKRYPETVIEEIVDIVDAKLWYPFGYGEQPLYKLTADIDGTVIKEVTFGIREVVILEIEDAPGSPEAETAAKVKKSAHLDYWDRNEGSSCFHLLINGVRIFCTGANWVPAEPFPSNEADEKLDYLVKMAREGNFNMLRVWGGGIFEHDEFYSACDRLGILVTQDFLMACGTYPEHEPDFIKKLKLETRAGALALRNHPCLVWWSGDNENAVRGDENMPSYSGRRAALECIAPILAELDPHRRFLPSSPYGGVPYASAVRGTSHNTQYLGNFFAWIRNKDFSHYREYFEQYLCRFCAEQPAMGMPYISSLKKFMSEEDIFGDDMYVSEYHTKNNPGLGPYTLYGYVEMMSSGMFGDFKDGLDRTKKMMYLQCEWIRLSLELFRRNAWFSSGIVYWMLNDCWPAANSWSMIDYYCAPKPAYYMFKRCAAPVMSSITEEEGEYRVYVSHVGSGKASGSGRLHVCNIRTGEEPWETTASFTELSAESRRLISVDKDVLAPYITNETVLLFDMEYDGKKTDRAYFLPYSWYQMAWEDGEYEIISEDDTSITVSAPVTLPVLLLDVPYVLEENSMFVKKGETVRLTKKRAL